MRFLIVPAIALALTACNTNSATDRTIGGAALGAGAGAAIGGIAGGWQGAGIGALAGGAAGALIGRATTPNACLYRDVYGRTYQAACP